MQCPVVDVDGVHGMRRLAEVAPRDVELAVVVYGPFDNGIFLRLWFYQEVVGINVCIHEVGCHILVRRPVILVPSPNVAEDHQTKNALALVNKQAALYVKDKEATMLLLPLAIDTVKDAAKLANLSENILKMALPDAAEIIAKEVIALAQTK